MSYVHRDASIQREVLISVGIASAKHVFGRDATAKSMFTVNDKLYNISTTSFMTALRLLHNAKRERESE